jgi:hypothetical protein
LDSFAQSFDDLTYFTPKKQDTILLHTKKTRYNLTSHQENKNTDLLHTRKTRTRTYFTPEKQEHGLTSHQKPNGAKKVEK